MFLAVGLLSAASGFLWHGWTLAMLILIPDGLSLSIGDTASFIGLQLALVAIVGCLVARLRGIAGGLLILAGLVSLLTGGHAPLQSQLMTWQIKLHILTSLFAYGLLTVGLIVAIFALVQEKRLQAGRLSSINQLFAPLETTELLLFGITTAGFLTLVVAISTGFAFVDDLFARHLIHKTVLSILAVTMFGLLLAGRWLAGWRGKRAVYLYIWGFAILGLAYFGDRVILEKILGETWS